MADITTVWQIFTALQPILNRVGPIAMLSISLYFIRSFFD